MRAAPRTRGPIGTPTVKRAASARATAMPEQASMHQWLGRLARSGPYVASSRRSRPFEPLGRRSARPVQPPTYSPANPSVRHLDPRDLFAQTSVSSRSVSPGARRSVPAEPHCPQYTALLRHQRARSRRTRPEAVGSAAVSGSPAIIPRCVITLRIPIAPGRVAHRAVAVSSTMIAGSPGRDWRSPLGDARVQDRHVWASRVAEAGDAEPNPPLSLRLASRRHRRCIDRGQCIVICAAEVCVPCMFHV